MPISLSPDLTPPLLSWYAASARVLPWRRDREPYHVWLSEIMLQQTRVQAVIEHYLRFLAVLPDIAALAACEEDKLLKLWEGLGYYSRARNLQKAAKTICALYGGVFPTAYADIRALPGIGAYTAGAIASICFEQPRAAVDGNVLRVCSRLCNDATPIENPAFRRDVALALEEIYPAGQCGAFTQALMELGATLCGPNTAPRCAQCPVASFCQGRAAGTASGLPVRGKKAPRREEQHTVLLLRCDDCLAVCRRPAQGLLAGMWELPNVPGHLTMEQALAAAAQLGAQPLDPLYTLRRTHIFTHITWDLLGISIRCGTKAPGLTWASPAALAGEMALPTAFRQFLEATP